MYFFLYVGSSLTLYIRLVLERVGVDTHARACAEFALSIEREDYRCGVQVIDLLGEHQNHGRDDNLLLVPLPHQVS